MENFDFDSIAAEFDATYGEETNKEAVEAVEPTEEVDTETDIEEVEGNDEEPTDKESTEEVDSPASKEEVPDDDKRNRAFADLRRQAEENKKAAEFLSKLANQSGMTPDEVLQTFEQRVLAEEAKKNNVPVEVMERLQNLEKENSSFKEQTIAQKMDSQIQNVIKTYNATDDDIRATFTEMLQSGVDPRTNPNVDFEKFYKAANFDKILEAKVNESKQQSLAQKKQRQQQAAIPSGTSVTQSGNSDATELAKKDALDILANW